MHAPTERNAVTIAIPQQRQTVLWIIAILLAIIATALVVRSENGIARAYGDSAVMGSRGIMAFTGQIDKNSYGLFMVDTDNSTVWCYQYLPATRTMKLVAARSYVYDRYLRDYGFEMPLDETKKLLAQEREIQERNARGGGAPIQSSDALDEALRTDTSPADAFDLKD